MIETSELEQKAAASKNSILNSYLFSFYSSYTLGYEIFISEYDQYMDGI